MRIGLAPPDFHALLKQPRANRRQCLIFRLPPRRFRPVRSDALAGGNERRHVPGTFQRSAHEPWLALIRENQIIHEARTQGFHLPPG